MHKIRIGLFAALLMFAINSQPAHSASYPITQGNLGLQNLAGNPVSVVNATGSLVIAGSGFLPGTPVQVILHSTPVLLLTTPADGSGSIRAAVSIPSGFSGSHVLEALGSAPAGGTTSLTQTILITTAATNPLPTTGSDSTLPLVFAGLATALAGIVSLGVWRRLRTR